MERYLDYKATIWFRIPIGSEERLQEVIKQIEENVLPTQLYDTNLEFEGETQCDALYDTEEFIPVNENDGQPTIEVMEETEKGWLKAIWDNSFESELKRKQNKN